jgi:hypothetical protein
LRVKAAARRGARLSTGRLRRHGRAPSSPPRLSAANRGGGRNGRGRAAGAMGRLLLNALVCVGQGCFPVPRLVMLKYHDSSDVEFIARQLERLVGPQLARCSWLVRHAFRCRIVADRGLHDACVLAVAVLLLLTSLGCALLATSWLVSTAFASGMAVAVALLSALASAYVPWRYVGLLRPAGESRGTALLVQLVNVSPSCHDYFDVLIGKSESPLHVDVEVACCLARRDGVALPVKPMKPAGSGQLFDHYFGCCEP